jgi:hypothetical protein
MDGTERRIRSTDTGLIYRNPKPHVYSIHAFFPSVVLMENGELLATLALGQALESPTVNTYVARSVDGGRTWKLEDPIRPASRDRLITRHSRVTALPDGEVVVLTAREDRTDNPEQAIHPETMGRRPMAFTIVRSSDHGQTWSDPELLEPPLVGPAFELCCPITPLSDGRWIIPTHTWPGWDGSCPHGPQMVAFVSYDRGRTWPDHMEVMRDPEERVWYWESKIVELLDGRLLAVAWAHDVVASEDHPNQYAISEDGGETWSPPTSTGLLGQTLTPFVLDSGEILSVYRRMDEPGLWASLSHLEGDRWVNDAWEPLWGARSPRLVDRSGDTVKDFQALRFGAPCITRLGDGALLVAFWCYEDCISNIRWFRLQVD